MRRTGAFVGPLPQGTGPSFTKSPEKHRGCCQAIRGKAEELGQLGTGHGPMDLSGSQLSSLCRLSDPGQSWREGQSRSAALVGEASDARGVWVGTGGTEIKDGSLGCEAESPKWHLCAWCPIPASGPHESVD